jgi:hypothetical protein
MAVDDWLNEFSPTGHLEKEQDFVLFNQLTACRESLAQQ